MFCSSRAQAVSPRGSALCLLPQQGVWGACGGRGCCLPRLGLCPCTAPTDMGLRKGLWTRAVGCAGTLSTNFQWWILRFLCKFLNAFFSLPLAPVLICFKYQQRHSLGPFGTSALCRQCCGCESARVLYEFPIDTSGKTLQPKCSALIDSFSLQP